MIYRLFFSLLGAEATNGFTDEYYRTLAYNRDIGGPRGIDGALKLYNLDALVLPVWGMLSTPAGSSTVGNRYMH